MTEYDQNIEKFKMKTSSLIYNIEFKGRISNEKISIIKT